MKINSLLVVTFLFSLFLSGAIQAREFYNTEGQSIEAELLSVENGNAVMKLKAGRTVKVPITKLSTADQNYVKAWWEKNKNRITGRDVKISIRQKNIYTKRPTTKVTKKGKIKTSESEFTYLCKVDNFSAKNVNGIKASYTVHKRVAKRGKNGSSSNVELITNSITLGPLESNGEVRFVTEGVKCNDLSDTEADLYKRESVIGMVLTLSVDGKEILTQSHPENLLKRLKEAESRQERKEEIDDKREERKEIADGKREDTPNTGLTRREREDMERAKRKRELLEAKEKRKREDQEKRDKNKKRFQEKLD